MRKASVLGIDPTACEGVGICAHVAPDLVRLDSWGYPILVAASSARRDGAEGSSAVDSTALRTARRAVAGCPRRALFMVEESS